MASRVCCRVNCHCCRGWWFTVVGAIAIARAVAVIDIIVVGFIVDISTALIIVSQQTTISIPRVSSSSLTIPSLPALILPFAPPLSHSLPFPCTFPYAYTFHNVAV